MPGASSTSWASCTSDAASTSWRRPTTRRRSHSARTPPACRPTAAASPGAAASPNGPESLGFEALALAGDSEATAAAARANNILGLVGCGRRYLERSLELSRELPDPAIRIAALNNLARDDVATGALGSAETLVREALALCVEQGDRHHEAALRNNLADILHHSGHPEAAMEELKRAVSVFAAIGGEDEQRFPEVWSLAEW